MYDVLHILLSGSVEYNECAIYRNRPWCASTVNVNGVYEKWGYCDDKKCPMSTTTTITSTKTTTTATSPKIPTSANTSSKTSTTTESTSTVTTPARTTLYNNQSEIPDVFYIEAVRNGNVVEMGETSVYLFTKSGSTDQQWTLNEGTLINPKRNKKIDLNGTKLVLLEVNYSMRQTSYWTITAGQIVHSPSGMALTVTENGLTAEVPSASSLQQWKTVSSCSSETSAGCKTEKGYCGKATSCPSTNIKHGHCPLEEKCCTSMPYQESKCAKLGGLCMDKCECSNINGEVLAAGSCPKQPGGIICCKAAQTPCSIEINSRSDWNARDPKSTRAMHAGPAKYIFVHHTDGDSCFSKEDCAEEVKTIQDFHMDPNWISPIASLGPRNWDDIGYSFLIGGDGSVWEGRGYDVTGAHTEGCNMVGYGVAFLGTCTKPPEENWSLNGHNEGCPTPEAKASFDKLIACMKSSGKLAPDYRLFGHKQSQDFKPDQQTECPGEYLYGQMKTWPRWCKNLVCKLDNLQPTCGQNGQDIPTLTGCIANTGEECAVLGGYCHTKGKCPGEKTKAGKCSDSNTECCLSVPYQEKPCKDAGGTCRDMYDCGTEFLDDPENEKDLCPEQPKNIKSSFVIESLAKHKYYHGIRCCKEKTPNEPCPLPGSKPTKQTCTQIGGTCKKRSACYPENSLVVRSKCEGSDYCCVKNPPACPGKTTIEDMDKHLNHVEGHIMLEGYVPLNGSGVTIATGYDLGHGSDISTCLKNSALWDRLKPFKGLKNMKAILAAGFDVKKNPSVSFTLDPDNPIVSMQEARSIDCCLKDEAIEATKAWTSGGTDCTVAVIVSLFHWCGVGGIHGNYDASSPKCRGNNVQSEKYIDNFLDAQGTDEDLVEALKKLKTAHETLGRPEWKAARIKKELTYLENCIKKNKCLESCSVERSSPYQEPECETEGGQCIEGGCGECSGENKDGKCPNQEDSGVVCCVDIEEVESCGTCEEEKIRRKRSTCTSK